MHPLPDGRLLVVGWTRVGTGIDTQTLVIDPAKQVTMRGPSLPVRGDALNWITSQPVAEGVLILASEANRSTDQETNTPVQPTPVGFLVRVNSTGALRVWALSNMPPRRRPMLLPQGSRSAVLLGGYRFGAKGAAMENTARPGRTRNPIVPGPAVRCETGRPACTAPAQRSVQRRSQPG